MNSLDSTLSVFRAIGEETRLRIMAILVQGELTVSELTQILGQSQPRVSRHLKILTDAGLIERHREGAWMFYRIAADAAEDTGRARLIEAIVEFSRGGDRVIARDVERFAQSRKARAAQAAQYFQENAAEWSKLRALHLPDSDIEERIVDIAGETSLGVFVDLGTGTGRMLEIFADRYEQAVGYDLSHEMLSIARLNLERAGIAHAQARHGDLFALPLESASVDTVCIHQVLHYLAAPETAISEAARLLRPGGKLIISDFAPHELEFLRDQHAHRRLGFADEEVRAWCANSHLRIAKCETLSPGAQDKEKLTVKIWLCHAPAGVRRLRAKPGRTAA
ncbi:MAG: metalloregulator ArsR/SmtB family transcription factor [Pseudomonadota bacterium]